MDDVTKTYHELLDAAKDLLLLKAYAENHLKLDVAERRRRHDRFKEAAETFASSCDEVSCLVDEEDGHAAASA